MTVASREETTLKTHGNIWARSEHKKRIIDDATYIEQNTSKLGDISDGKKYVIHGGQDGRQTFTDEIIHIGNCDVQDVFDFTEKMGIKISAVQLSAVMQAETDEAQIEYLKSL